MQFRRQIWCVLGLWTALYASGIAQVPGGWMELCADDPIVRKYFIDGLFADPKKEEVDVLRERLLREAMRELETAEASGDFHAQVLLNIAIAECTSRRDGIYQQFLRLRRAQVIHEGQIRQPSPALIALYSGLGACYMKLNFPDRAVQCNQKRLALADHYIPEPNLVSFRAWSTLAKSHFLNGDTAAGIQASYAALRIVKALKDSVFLASGHNNLGHVFEKAGMRDSALVHYETASRINGGFGGRHRGLQAGIEDNIANILEARHEYARAEARHRNILAQGGWPKRRTMKIHYKIARNAGKQGKYKVVTQMLAQWVDQLPKPTFQMSDLWMQDVLVILLDAYEKLGEAAAYARLARRRFAYLEKLEAARGKQIFKSVREIVLAGDEKIAADTRGFQLALDQKAAEVEAERLRVFLVLALSTLALGLIAFVFWRRISAARRARELEAMQRELTEKKLEAKQQDLKHMTNEVLVRQQAREEMLRQLQYLQSLDGATMVASLKSMILDLRARVRDGEKEELILSNVETVNTEFFNKLEADFPKLTKAEKELCGLLRLALSNKEIARIRGLTPASVKVTKNRLRKKLQLAPGEDVTAFLSRY